MSVTFVDNSLLILIESNILKQTGTFVLQFFTGQRSSGLLLCPQLPKNSISKKVEQVGKLQFDSDDHAACIVVDI